jgi:hypothetical protein
MAGLSLSMVSLPICNLAGQYSRMREMAPKYA